MSASTTLLSDAFGRIEEGVVMVVDELSPDDLRRRIGPDANPIGWLVWHLLRVQDDHVAEVAGTDQLWTSAGWEKRFGLPFEPGATGYAQSAEDVDSLAVTSELLVGYAGAVAAATQHFLEHLTDDDLDRVVDDNWDPPVTLGVRLMSVIGDDLKHLGQAEYVRGLL